MKKDLDLCRFCLIQSGIYTGSHLSNPIFKALSCKLTLTPFRFYFDLPAEQFHEVLEAVLSEEVKGALGRAQVDEQEDEQDDGQERNQHVPAGRQDVVPFGLV